MFLQVRVTIRLPLHRHTTRDPRDRSITHSLQRWISTKCWISQLECFSFLYYIVYSSNVCVSLELFLKLGECHNIFTHSQITTCFSWLLSQPTTNNPTKQGFNCADPLITTSIIIRVCQASTAFRFIECVFF